MKNDEMAMMAICFFVEIGVGGYVERALAQHEKRDHGQGEHHNHLNDAVRCVQRNLRADGRTCERENHGGNCEFDFDEAAFCEAGRRNDGANGARNLVGAQRDVRRQAGYQVRSERDEPAASRNGVDEHRQKHKRAHDEQRYGVHGFLTVSLLSQ